MLPVKREGAIHADVICQLKRSTVSHRDSAVCRTKIGVGFNLQNATVDHRAAIVTVRSRKGELTSTYLGQRASSGYHISKRVVVCSSVNGPSAIQFNGMVERKGII